MICLMGGVGWHGTRLGRSDSQDLSSQKNPYFLKNPTQAVN